MTTPENKDTNISRKRSKNYTAEEELLLVELVDRHKNVIENKKSDAVIWKQKEEAWSRIEEEFAATIGLNRHWKALRDKYEMLKRKSKAEMAEKKAETYKTGGGVSCATVSNISSKIASMLGDSATGLKNSFDSDFLTENDENWTELDSSIEVIDKEEFGKSSSSSVDKKPDWSSWNPTTLKQPKSKELGVGTKRKLNLEEEKIGLIVLQQQFYRDENIRAQEKHNKEIQSLELKNEILQLELSEKKKLKLTNSPIL